MAWQFKCAFARKVLIKYLFWLCLCVQYRIQNRIKICTHPIHHNYYKIMLLCIVAITHCIIAFLVDVVFIKSNWKLLEILYLSRTVTILIRFPLLHCVVRTQIVGTYWLFMCQFWKTCFSTDLQSKSGGFTYYFVSSTQTDQYLDHLFTNPKKPL